MRKPSNRSGLVGKCSSLVFVDTNEAYKVEYINWKHLKVRKVSKRGINCIHSLQNINLLQSKIAKSNLITKTQ